MGEANQEGGRAALEAKGSTADMAAREEAVDPLEVEAAWWEGVATMVEGEGRVAVGGDVAG